MTTFWSYRLRSEAKDARETVLGLLPSQARWDEAELCAEAGITARMLRLVLGDLLQEELVEREDTPGGAFYRTPPEPAARTDGDLPLSREAEAILARLAVRPDTARHLSATLNIPDALTAAALQALQDQGMVSCRYVGMLTIYRRIL